MITKALGYANALSLPLKSRNLISLSFFLRTGSGLLRMDDCNPYQKTIFDQEEGPVIRAGQVLRRRTLIAGTLTSLVTREGMDNMVPHFI